MTKFVDKLRLRGSTPKPLSSGFYVYHSPESEPVQFRLHLRVEPDGEGVLIVNASSILHLNQTATEFAYYLMRGENESQITEKVAERFNAPAGIIAQDVVSFREQLMNFVRKSDQEPIADFGFEPLTEFTDLSAPYRLDCCLTHRTESADAGREQADISTELDTNAWKDIIHKAYNAGIPHLVFYGGEPTLREDLIPLLQYCEELGLVTGLVSSGEKLCDDSYLGSMLTSGLDHLLIPYNPEDARLKQALTKILPLDLYTCVNLIIGKDTDYQTLVKELADLGTNAISIVPSNQEAYEHYLEAAEFITNSNIPLVSDLPLPEVQIELAKLRNNAAEPQPETEYVIVGVQPDGAIFSHPCSGKPLGNLATETWDKIWDRRF